MNVDHIIQFHKDEAEAAIAERKKGLIDYDPLRHTSAKADFHKQAAEIIRVLCREFLMNTWQDIATAPKDGTSILGFCEGAKIPAVMHWSIDRWTDLSGDVDDVDDPQYAFYDATHWMPLPKGPNQ